MTLNTFEEEQLAVQQIRDGRQQIFDQLSNVIIGQEDVIEQLLVSLFAGGNCLITGAPRARFVERTTSDGPNPGANRSLLVWF